MVLYCIEKAVLYYHHSTQHLWHLYLWQSHLYLWSLYLLVVVLPAAGCGCSRSSILTCAVESESTPCLVLAKERALAKLLVPVMESELAFHADPARVQAVSPPSSTPARERGLPKVLAPATESELELRVDPARVRAWRLSNPSRVCSSGRALSCYPNLEVG
mmetsp:Transcript_46930/g.84826  ORF Transcript_46930/g.84826 Transcript_46930/m.84826 type:complete len:161 (+) Transcript_46930:109-591(+)